MATEKAKRMTNAEKKHRAEIKHKLVEDGILPSPKKPLNRKKFLEDVRREWNEQAETSGTLLLRISEALAVMSNQKDGRGNLTLEAVGAPTIDL